MPQHGLRPTPEPKKGFDTLIPACHWYAKKQEDITLLSLLLLNKAISSEVADVLYKEVPLRIDIIPDHVRFLNSDVHMWSFPSHQPLTKIPAITRMRHYHLDIKLTKGTALAPNSLSYLSQNIKECIRFITDALSYNNTIKTLTVALPCYCAAINYQGYSWTVKGVRDMLEPLSRLHLASPIRILPSEKTWPNPDTCSNPSCERMKETAELSLPHSLDRIPLTEMETKWRDLKTMPRPRSTLDGCLFPSPDYFRHDFSMVRNALESGDRMKFERCMEQVVSHIDRSWNLMEAREAREAREKTERETEEGGRCQIS
ncbi:MAG: hypothetical protein Q9212_007211 [Teloschistes hypoglaucus]